MWDTANGHHLNQGHPNPVLKGRGPNGIPVLPGSQHFFEGIPDESTVYLFPSQLDFGP